jgi:hypothetical protein
MKKMSVILILQIFFLSTIISAQERDPRKGKNCPCRIVEDKQNRQIKLLDRNNLILKIYLNTYSNRNVKLYYNENEFYIMRNNSGIYQVTVYAIATGKTVRNYSVRSTELDNWIR